LLSAWLLAGIALPALTIFGTLLPLFVGLGTPREWVSVALIQQIALFTMVLVRAIYFARIAAIGRFL
jgi:hypothetical protein